MPQFPSGINKRNTRVATQSKFYMSYSMNIIKTVVNHARVNIFQHRIWIREHLWKGNATIPSTTYLHTYVQSSPNALSQFLPTWRFKKKKSNINHASFHFLKIAILNTQFWHTDKSTEMTNHFVCLVLFFSVISSFCFLVHF